MFVFNIFSNRGRSGSLCYTCVYAHLVDGDNGNRLTYCTYGYPTRPIKFGVSNCTTYTVRSAKPITVVRGFTMPNDKAAS